MANRSFARVMLALLLCAAGGAYCQRQFASANSVEVVECESSGCTPGAGGSATWSLSNSGGVGHFGNGDQPMTIEHIDENSIAIRRVDTAGNAKGLSALYMGRIDGERIIGSVIYYDPNRADHPRTSAWNGLVRGSIASLRSTSPVALPKYHFSLRENEGNSCLQSAPSHPVIWTFPTAQGQGWIGDSPRAMVLEDIQPGFLVARRVDGDALGGLTAVYFGELNDKNITGSVLYFDRGRPDQPRTDIWCGVIQDAFIPEDTTSVATAQGASAAPLNNTASNTNSPAKMLPSPPAIPSVAPEKMAGKTNLNSNGGQEAATPIKPGSAPKKMRLCATICETLTWSSDHYDGVPDGSSKVTEIFRLKGFGAMLIMVGHPNGVDEDDDDETLSGSIAASGDHLDAGVLMHNYVNTKFTATWSTAPDNFVTDIPAFHRSKTRPSILLPPGASEAYASWDDQTRAILMDGDSISEESTLQLNDATKPCGGADSVTDAHLALQIAKYAYRANEIERGNCWAARAAALHNVRAEVLIGLGWSTGWQGRVDLVRTCRTMQTVGERDGWAMHILKECYDNGSVPGFTKDDPEVGKVAQWLEANGGGVDRIIGSDDIEARREAERQELIDHPPMTDIEHSCTNPGVPCQQVERVVDQNELDRELDAINHRYAAIQ